jgi:ribosomal-protein-alanine N-acetyltransferase
MSAQLDTVPRLRRMDVPDLDAVMAIENAVYTHPWTRSNFVDSLGVGHHCWVMECGAGIAGYCVIAIAANEAHLLNLSIAAGWQRQGLGTQLLQFVLGFAGERAAQRIFLEVRASNTPAIALYARAGFREIGTRRGYYPLFGGREDARVLEFVP